MADISKSRRTTAPGRKLRLHKVLRPSAKRRGYAQPVFAENTDSPSPAQTNTPALSDENGTRNESWASNDAPIDHALTPETRSPAHTASAQALECSSFPAGYAYPAAPYRRAHRLARLGAV